jgi:hypothetical protein
MVRRLTLAGLVVLVAGCGSDDSEPRADSTSTTAGAGSTTTTAVEVVSDLVDIGDGRTLHLECAGEGSPLILLEAGDESDINQWRLVMPGLSTETRTCAYDRAGLGQSVEATGCRGLDDILGDLEALLDAAALEGPYVLVGTSGGGYLMAGFAARHPADVAGVVLVETPKAITIMPPGLAEAIACDAPNNVEHRDYYAVEHAVWDSRAQIGDFPMAVISNDYGENAPPGDEQTNVADQQGWLVLSPSSNQIVVTSGHDVPENEPELVVREILAVLNAARSG